MTLTISLYIDSYLLDVRKQNTMEMLELPIRKNSKKRIIPRRFLKMTTKNHDGSFCRIITFISSHNVQFTSTLLDYLLK